MIRNELQRDHLRLILAVRNPSESQAKALAKVLHEYRVSWWRFYDDFLLLRAPIDLPIEAFDREVRLAITSVVPWLAAMHANPPWYTIIDVDDPNASWGYHQEGSRDWLSQWVPFERD